MSQRHIRSAIDIGGTFTDLASYDSQSKGVRFEKSLTTPSALQDAVLTCFEKGEIDLSRLSQFVHGSTVAINAVIQRNGSKTALVTTEGFKDLYQIGRANRPDTYNLLFQKPTPLVAGNLAFPVRERMTAVGGEVVPASAEQFSSLIHSERLRYDKLVREAQIKPD